ncbi:hypothetical protein M2322_001202 [Rhodoblastus acidophilus]|uniref:hypothetical protein n=1 Tax=Rhodoblastus acidophilus TaxID=1074 RepID=UPI002224FA27|nr:hypothetical protein [Rhodoblastus acidophilus]MCW2315668.1 hypothetical protein [Rhodoblastus acidophilus]
MPSIPVAHLTEQGQDMVIVIMDPRFAQASPSQQEATIGQLQQRANACGLKGTIALVWDGGGRMDYLVPQPWHDFFRSITLDDVRARINSAISWDG